jgi:putative hydrolase of the HAD superfamily
VEKKYTDIFFDLDRTLWDFDSNSRNALTALYARYGLEKEGVRDASIFVDVYQRINERLWAQYRQGRIQKAKLRRMRFTLTLQHFGCNNKELGATLDEEYVKLSPYQTGLIPGSLEVLTHLSQNYKLHIITNGFEEVQHIKLQESKLRPYFDVIITSERAQARKPHPVVFKMAMKHANVHPEACIMIGDDLGADVLGAQRSNIDQVYFNRHKIPHQENPTFEISDLEELRLIL